jgi:hypothetical protein
MAHNTPDTIFTITGTAHRTGFIIGISTYTNHRTVAYTAVLAVFGAAC